MASTPHSILVTVTLPTTRSDGTAVTPGSISEVDILRAVSVGGVPATFAKVASVTTGISGPTVSFVDNSVVAGTAYEYEAACVDTQSPPVVGATSSPSAEVLVPLALAPLSAPSVSAVLQ
jgi:hypothetical protein